MAERLLLSPLYSVLFLPPWVLFVMFYPKRVVPELEHNVLVEAGHNFHHEAHHEHEGKNSDGDNHDV